MLKKEILEIICCPICKGDLDYAPEQERLTCKKCGKSFPVRNDIPVLLPDDSDSR